MSEEENVRVLDAMWSADDPIAAMETTIADDCIQEWPQSGERVVGRDNIMAIIRNYPGMPTLTVRRTVSAGNLVVREMRMDYGGAIYHGISVYEFAGGKIVRETDYFAEPFDPPAWRAQWVEPI
jgi:hypothetical protein